jgi:hypothetical protein
MKYYLTEFYKFKILIAISIILGSIVVPTVLNNFLKEAPSFKESFKVMMLNHETSLKYFLISNSLDSDVYTTELILSPKNSSPNIISTFTNLFLSDQQMKILSNSIKVDELELQKNINFFYRYPGYQDTPQVLQLILTDNLPEGDIELILNEAKVLLLKLGLDESDYYFDNENLIERGALGSLKKFQLPVKQSFLPQELEFSARPIKVLEELQFQDKLKNFSGTVDSDFIASGITIYNLSGSDRQELTDFKLYMMDYLMDSLNFFPSKSLKVNYFIVFDGEIKTEKLQSDNRLSVHILLGGLAGLSFSLIIVYVNILRKDIRKELENLKEGTKLSNS